MRFALAGALVLLAALLAVTQVFAHAEYDRSTPGRDEVVAGAPAQVDVFFTQDVKKVEGRYFVRVYDGSGAVGAEFCETAEAPQVSDGDGVVDDDDRTHISALLPPDLPDGRYVVCWMTTSDLDDDEDAGAFCFYIGSEPSEEQAAECAAFEEEEEPTATEGQATELPVPTATSPPAGDETPTALPPVDAVDVDDDGVSAGVIIGIIVGVIAIAAVAGGVAVWLRRT
jgi:hypothetical protein